MSTTSEPGRPGRYQRSVAGLIVALVLTVGAVAVVMWVLGLFRGDLEVDPENVDLSAGIATAQESGLRPVYPSSLPEGWVATAAEVPSDGGGGYEIRLLTDDGKFVGIRQADDDLTRLLATYVDEEPAETEGFTADGSVADEWDGYTDDKGDTAYAAEVPGGKGDQGPRDETQVVLVYGSAPAEDLQELIERLTREPVGG